MNHVGENSNMHTTQLLKCQYILSGENRNLFQGENKVKQLSFLKLIKAFDLVLTDISFRPAVNSK